MRFVKFRSEDKDIWFNPEKITAVKCSEVQAGHTYIRMDEVIIEVQGNAEDIIKRLDEAVNSYD